ncbi:organomercurial lyase [Phytoactinopolyspora endophytica]|uniref:organomercurial lyase n=1 Tax=Phytoactinopolyspora endophytica TaxID=1642495 RepID=UPI0013EA9895|nr:organomercurial lyase [Phytoactinopolyspora endophytica]
MTSVDATQAISDLTRRGGGLDLGPGPARLLVGMLRLLAQEGPVTRERAGDMVADLGIDREQADELLEAWTEHDEDGDIVGLGVTYNPTAHQMTVDGVRMWAWCAMDTLIYAFVLDKQITVESKSPGSGGTVRLQVSPAGITNLDPVYAVITWPARDSDQVDISSKAAIWGTFCHHSFFFRSRAEAEQWASGRDDVVILAMDVGLAVGHELAAALLRYEPS